MDHPDVTMMIVAHNAFRRDLARMQHAATQADDPAKRVALRAGWTAFNRYLTIHHTAEDTVLWPMIHAKLGDNRGATAVLTDMADEHALLDPIFRAIDADLEHGPAARLIALFSDLAAVLTDHLEHEEAAALPLVEKTLSAAEWDTFGDDQRNRVGLADAGGFLGWLLDGTPPDTRDKVLSFLPSPVRLAYRQIWGPQYRRRSPWRREPTPER